LLWLCGELNEEKSDEIKKENKVVEMGKYG
jgi:hypothetical protein